MTPKQWLGKFLDRPGRSTPPDGRPLYAYRVADEEYEDLIASLRFANSLFEVSELAKNHVSTKWSMAFVLFAAEWWRREYAGGHWRWGDIFQRIGDELQVGDRNKAIEQGLRYWHREVKKGDHHREFIGTIAMEAGLPQRCLVDSRYEKLLRDVIRNLPDKRRFGYGGADLAKQNCHYLPQTFRRPEVYDLLGKIAEVCVELRERHTLSERVDPLLWLEKAEQGWRDLFPLNVSDEGAEILLKGLIGEAAKLDGSGASGIAVRRSLVNSPGGYRLQARLHLPQKKVACEEVRLLLTRETGEELPSRLTIGFERENGVQIAVGLDRQNDHYRIKQRKMSFGQQRAVEEVRLVLEDGRKALLGKAVPPGSMELVPDQPWVFSDATNGRDHELIGQGRVKVRYEFALVALPEEAEIDDSAGQCEFIDKLVDLKRRIYRFQGQLRIRMESGFVLLVTGAERTEAVEYEFVGNELDFKTIPKQTFCGLPKVWARHVDGKLTVLCEKNLRWRPFGRRKAWQDVKTVAPHPGIIELGAVDPETKEVLFRRKVALLPKRAKLRLQAGKTARQGEIILNHFGRMKLEVRDEEIEWHEERVDDLVELCLATKLEHPPSHIAIDLIWHEDEKPLHIYPPFPAKGVHFFSKERAIGRGKTVFLSRLHGIHARIFNQSEGHSLTAHVYAHLDGNRNVYFQGGDLTIDEYAEIRLIEYETEIIRLFAIADNLDSKIILGIEVGGQSLASLIIQQYECRLVRNEVEGSLRLNRKALQKFPVSLLENMKLHALPLGSPECNPVELRPRLSEGVPTGEWFLEPEKKQAGTWLIFPSSDSNIKFRPIAWENKMTSLEFSGHSMKVACMLPRGEREAVYDSQLEEMKRDPLHKGWVYLEKTLDRLGHLPLSSHDLVRRIVRHPHIMAGLFLLMERDEIERFETELPFMWERVPWQAWCNGIDLLLSKYKGEFDGEQVAMLARDKLDELGRKFPAMRSGIDYLAVRVGADAPNPVNDAILEYILFGGQDTEMQLLFGDQVPDVQKLLRDNSAVEIDWPQHFSDEIMWWADDLPQDFPNLLKGAENFCDAREKYFRRPVIYAPLLLGIEWVTGRRIMMPVQGESKELFLYKISQLRAFHRDWFDNAMNMTIGYGLGRKR